ncbi:hypothetical protein HOD38_02100 [archaeon]|jgi:hypothetical protein|nr:hypothetical protein [archaeon]MBT4397035.1 hypothetical protein [archaeon]MBT4441026.1 hypothetical protein [archaeon]
MDRRTAIGWAGTLVGLTVMWGIFGSTTWKNEITPIMQQRYAYNTALEGVSAGRPGPQEDGDCVICENLPSDSYKPQNAGLRPEIITMAQDIGCELGENPLQSYNYSSSSFEQRGVPHTYTCVRFSTTQ